MTIPQIDELDLLHSTICKAVGDPRRIQILYALHEEPLHVSALAEALDAPQSTISRHLAVLRQSAMVENEREGAAVVYSIADERIIKILDEMRAVLRGALERQSNLLD